MRLSNIDIAVLILSLWVFLVNVTEVSSTLGWIMGLAAAIIVLIPVVRR